MSKKPAWSNDRPIKPVRDPILDDLLPLMRADRRSTFAKANVSGLSPSTLKNWESGKTRHPQSVSVQMAYKMLGYELRPVATSNVHHLNRRRVS
jgi:hypothetical protein